MFNKPNIINKYKDIIIDYNDEEFRLTRLKKIIDELHETIPPDYIIMIHKIKDDKGTLNIYWNEKPSLFYKMVINSLWMDYYEFHTNHIIIYDDCPCCSKPPQKENQEIKEYLNNLNNLNYII